MAYKYKVTEAPAPNLAKQGNYKLGDISYSKDGGTKFIVNTVDSETGKVGWKIVNLPNFEKLMEDVDEATLTAKGVYTKTKDDEKWREIYEDLRVIRNKIRTHLRNEYPDEYKRMKTIGMNEEDIDEATGIDGNVIDLDPSNKTKLSNYVKLPHHLAAALLDISDEIMSDEAGTIGSQPQIKQALTLLKKAAEKAMTGEKEVEEVSTSGAAGAYLTPYAFRKKGSKPDDEAYKELGYKVVKEKALPVVRKKLAKVPKAKKVASKYKMKMPSGLVSTLGYTVSEDATKSANINKQGQHPGEDLGPGPKAGDEGVVDSAYIKQFKFKLVPKNKDGTYVQKGSGMIVKNLF